MMKSLLDVYTTVEEKRFQEASIADKMLRNIHGEYRNTAGLASLQANPNVSAISYFENFTAFIKKEQDFRSLYVLVYAMENKNYSVTVGNWLDDKIDATVNVTSSLTKGMKAEINDSQNVTFGFEALDYGSVVINLTYMFRAEEVNESFSAAIRVTNSSTSFFDLSIYDKKEFVRIKDVFNETW